MSVRTLFLLTVLWAVAAVYFFIQGKHLESVAFGCGAGSFLTQAVFALLDPRQRR